MLRDLKRIPIAAAMLIGLVFPAEAQQIPPLVTLSSSVAASNPYLASRLAALTQERATLHGKINSLNARCGAIEEGSTAEAACKKDQAALAAALSSHIQRSNAFNAAANAASVAATNPKCPPGSSLVGSGCERNSYMRPEKDKLPALHRQAQKELNEIRAAGFDVLWEGVWTILSMSEGSEAGSAAKGAPKDEPNSDAEDASEEMSEHVKAYLELEEEIEEITGDKAAAKRKLAERLSHVYVRTKDGGYAVNLSKTTAPGQNYLPDAQTPLKATEPISGSPYVPGDVAIPPPLTDKRPISPNGYKPGENFTDPRDPP